MTTVSITNARNDLANLVNKVAYGGERIVIKRRGKNSVVIVPLEDAEILDELERRADVARIRRGLKESGESWETVRAELGL